MKTFLKYFLIVGLVSSSLCYATGETPDVQASQDVTQQDKIDTAGIWANLKQAAQVTAQDVLLATKNKLQATKNIANGAVQGAYQGAQAAAEKMKPELLNKINEMLNQSEGYVRQAKYLGICVMISQLMILGLCGVTAYNSFVGCVK